MEEKEVLVKVEGLSKKFCKDLKTSLWYGVQDLFSNFRGNKTERHLRDKEFWAVKDINFELRRGECLGLIGHNGAGKSTLLKILNGLIKPDAGKVTIKGRVGALIELGAGFNPILSGRENIYNNGAILGFTRKEIDSKLEEIIDFAEIREFIDMPVQNYSSGMKVRLGFAVAAQMQPDVLIIDEVLAVGDLGFVLKCFKKIDSLLPGTAIIFVSHNMPMVSRICTHVLVLSRGRSLLTGKDVSEGLDLYYNQFSTNSSSVIFTDKSIELLDFKISNSDEPVENNKILWGEIFSISFSLYFVENRKYLPIFNFIITDKEQRPVARIEPTNPTGWKAKKEVFKFILDIPNIYLSKGIYDINFLALDAHTKGPILRINSVESFQIIHDKDIWEPLYVSSPLRLSGDKARLKNLRL